MTGGGAAVGSLATSSMARGRRPRPVAWCIGVRTDDAFTNWLAHPAKVPNPGATMAPARPAGRSVANRRRPWRDDHRARQLPGEWPRPSPEEPVAERPDPARDASEPVDFAHLNGWDRDWE